MGATKTRVKRSERLELDERQAYKELVERLTEKLGTKIDVAEFFGFSTVTLDNILLRGSGKPGTIATIREKIGFDNDQA